MSSAPMRINPLSRTKRKEMWKTKQRNSIVWFIPPLVLSQIHTVASKLADARYIPLGDQSTETERQKVNSPVYELEGNWDELTFAKTSGTVTGDQQNWPIADRRDPRNNSGTHSNYSPLIVS